MAVQALPIHQDPYTLEDGERIVETFESDITLDGYYAAGSRAVLTDRRLIIVDPAYPNGHISFPFSEIGDLDVRSYYGNSALRIKQRGAGPFLEVLRFSRSLDDQAEAFIESVWRVIGETAGTERPDHAKAAKGPQPDKSRCRGCGRPLPPGQEVCPRCIDKRKVLRRSFAYLAKYPASTAINLALTVTITGLQLVPPYLTKTMVDDVLIPGNLSALWWVIAAIVATHALLSLLSAFHIYAINWLGNKVVVDLRTEVYAKLQELTLTFFDKRQTGWIMSRVTNDTSFLQFFMVQGLQQIIVHILMILGIVVVLFSMNWKLALMTLLPLPIVAVGTSWFSKRMHKVYHRIWRRVSNMHAMLGDTIPGIRVVKAFTREEDEVQRFIAKNQEVFAENMKAVLVSSYFFPSMGFLMALGTIVLWAYGGYEVIVGKSIQPGELMAFIGYTWMLYNPIQALSRSSEQLQGAVTAAERLFEILDTPPEVVEGEETIVLPEIKGEIEFRNVSFYYEKGDPVLKNINVKIKPGEMIGLVGPSGSGKTTMINLIARFYRVSEGELLIDGVNINRIDLNCLRKQIGLVLQEPFLFHGTIAENIAYGKPDATFEEIVQAAQLANAHEFIMKLPDGYDTRIGERGVGLSGGEKQRISIARAILKNPRILILDEATSAVDTETEKLIQEAIERLIKGRTTIAIAHRLSTLQNADRLLVLKDGEIVEQGTHEELLAKPDGLFRHFVELQREVAKVRQFA